MAYGRDELERYQAGLGPLGPGPSKAAERRLDVEDAAVDFTPSGEEPQFPFGANAPEAERLGEMRKPQGFHPGTVRHWKTGDVQKRPDGEWVPIRRPAPRHGEPIHSDSHKYDWDDMGSWRSPGHHAAAPGRGFGGNGDGHGKGLFDRAPRDPEKHEPAKWTSAGGVVLHALTPEGLKYVYLVKPAKNYGPWTLPKGRVDKGESKESAAVREVQEESGIRARVLPGGYLGSGEGTSSVTHFYVMVRTGGNIAKHDDETERVEAFTFDHARELLRRSGNKRDPAILDKAEQWVVALRAKMFGGHKS